MSTLKKTLARKIDEHRPRTVRLLKEYSDVKLSEVTIAQAIGGARGVRCLVTDTSYLDPMEGIRFRGKTIPETFAALPKYPGSDYPSVESFWWFILTGDDIFVDGKRPQTWTVERSPHLMETSIPGIFAAGDVRAGVVRRVASAVGQGSIAISMVHKYLEGV